MPPDPPSAAALIAAGRDALSRRAWSEAKRALESAVERSPTTEALELLADAAWWLDDEPTTFAARERAYRLYRQAGDRRGAARMAIWLANDSVEFRGQPAVANGWIRRADRLLEGLRDAPEYAWLRMWEGHLALMLRNDARQAKRFTAEAVESARALELIDVEMLALAIEGLALVTEGRVDEGISRLDEAATAVLAGELSDVNAAATVLCYLMDACDRVRDYDRAVQWCARVREWANDAGFPGIFAVCRPHYAVVLMWHGEWDEAEAELVAARRAIEQFRPPMAIESIVRLAELRCRQGRWDDAEALFSQVEDEPLAQLGRAELALDRGDVKAARDFGERFLRRIPAENLIERTDGLDFMVRALLAAGHVDDAANAANELRSIADRVPTDVVRAAAARSEALVAADGGDHSAARRLFEDALELYGRCRARFEGARTRVALAASLRELGRGEQALREASRAYETFAGLGAARCAEAAAALVSSLGGVVDRGSADEAPDGLTPREIELLRLLAGGRSNREIADHLILSVRTVERHISNIYDKIGASGKVARATATAYAYAHQLVPPPIL